MSVKESHGIGVYRCLVFVVLFYCVVFSPLAAKAEKPGASETIRTFNAALLEAMKRADELGYSGRYKLLEPVITDSFAFPFMASQALGRYWKPLTSEEQALFLKIYADWSIATYAGRFDGYSGERFELVSESLPDRGTVTVVSRLVEPNNEEVGFHYKLRRLEGKWRIVDIQISGVSQLALTRSQFVNVMKDKGLKGLVSMLNDKIEGFSKEKKR
jgi:phospholipid transport system substrate-binding protein